LENQEIKTDGLMQKIVLLELCACYNYTAEFFLGHSGDSLSQ